MEQQQFDIVRNKKTFISEPPRYEVIIHDDSETTIDFVFMILSVVFGKSEAEADAIVAEAQKNGNAVVGIYSFDIAKTKINKAHAMAYNAGFPLRFSTKKR